MVDNARRPLLVTGGAGFLGSSLVRRLEAEGYGRIVVPRSRDYSLVDVTRAAVEFGFRARTPFAVGLERTIRWYLADRAARR